MYKSILLKFPPVMSGLQSFVTITDSTKSLCHYEAEKVTLAQVTTFRSFGEQLEPSLINHPVNDLIALRAYGETRRSHLTFLRNEPSLAEQDCKEA